MIPKLALFLAVVCCVSVDYAPRVNLRELGLHFDEYNGKRIVIEGDVYSGEEMAGIQLQTGDPNAPELMLISLSEETSRKPGKLERRFLKSLKRSGKVHAIVEGYFWSSQSRVWGHQLCCRFRFKIDRVLGLGK